MASDLNTKIGRSLSVKLNRASGCDDKEKDKEKFGQTEEEPNKSSYKSKKGLSTSLFGSIGFVGYNSFLNFKRKICCGVG